MDIKIFANNPEAIYLQIVKQVKSLVESGRLPSGAELPSIRVLAQQLDVNPNTVARAYRELVTAGIATPRRTAGIYVAEKGVEQARGEINKDLNQWLDTLLDKAQHHNVGTEQLIQMLLERAKARQGRQGED